MMRQTVHYITMALLSVLVFCQGAFADPVVDIWENDGQPAYNGLAVNWILVVRNNSGSTYNENITQVRFYDLFSTQEPVLASGPGWFVNFSTGSAENLWDATLTPADDEEYIIPGDSKQFYLITYRPSASIPIAVGDRYGQGVIDGIGWQPPAPGDVFLGPVGLMGDMDCDGAVDLAGDLPLFVAALLNPSDYAPPPGCVIDRADMNGDDDYSGLDIPGFVAALIP